MGDKEYYPPRGLRDIVGREAYVYEYVFNEFRRISRLHGFQPVLPPTIEYYRLFEEKSGEEIKKTMYVFEDKAGRLLALRPEVTASITRIYLRKLRGEVKPVKLYYVSQCFRYEEPQFGRYREFWQGGLEVIGVKDVSGDLEAAYTASRFLDALGLKHKYIVGNVAIHRSLMKGYGIPLDVQDHVLHLIDKSMIDEAVSVLKKYSIEAGMAMKDLLSRSIDELESFIREYKDVLVDVDRVVFENERLIGFITSLRELGYEAVYDPGLVRGLAYYTGLIYEYKAISSKLRISIGGGGRYDGLSTVYGGPYEYFTGLALGLDRVILALEDGFSLSRGLDAVIILSTDIPLSYGLRIKSLLEDYGLSSMMVVVGKIGKGVRLASRKAARFALIIGRREYSSGSVSVKDLSSGVQVEVSLEALPLYLYSEAKT